jgi:hypothetical protein
LLEAELTLRKEKIEKMEIVDLFEKGITSLHLYSELQ